MKVIKRISRYILWLFAGIIVFLIGIYIFIQTDTFNKWALEYTLSKMNNSWETKQSKVNAESLTGNILDGIKLNNGSVTIKNDTLVSFSSLEVKYDLWALLRHQISVDLVELKSPRIYLSSTKDKDGNSIWNFSNLFSSPAETDTTGSPFDWDLAVNTLKIENGFIRIAGDYADTVPLWRVQREKPKQFDFNNLDVTDLMLELSAKYYKDYKNINIKDFSFNTNSDFVLNKLALDASINFKDTVTDVKNLELVTGRSNVKIDWLHADKLNPMEGFRYELLKDKYIELKLTADKFSFADLRFFLPQVNMVDSAVTLTVDAAGKYGDLNINSLHLVLPNSDISLRGNVKHLDSPDSLYFDVTGSELSIYPGDVFTVLNIEGIPDYSNLGIVQGNIYYRGTPNSFYAEYDLKTDAGYVNGANNLDISNEIYNGTVTTTQLDLGKVLKDKKLNSSLNLTAKYNGIGFDLNTMSTRIVYSLNNSTIAGYRLNSAGEVKTVNNNLNVDIRVNSNAGSVNVNGRVNIANMNNPVYSVKGNFSRLDISAFTKNTGDRSSLNAAFDINGRGSNLDNINGKFDMLVESSSYSVYQIPKTPLKISINNNGSQSSVKVITDMAEINANGKFNISDIGDVIKQNISSLSNVIKTKMDPQFASIDAVYGSISNGRDVSLAYDVTVKDTSKLNMVTAPFGIVFNGNIKGNVINSPNGFSSSTILDVKDFRYRDTSIILKNVYSSLSFKNDYTSRGTESSFSPYIIALDAAGQQIVFDGNQIDSAMIMLNMANSIADVRVSGRKDSTAGGKLKGNIDLSGEKIALRIDSLSGKYKLYEAVNSNNWLISYLPGKEVDIEQMGIKSRSAEVNVSGVYSLTNNSDIKIESSNLKLKDIYSVIRPVDTTIVKQKFKYPVEGELTKLFINFKGTIENPEIDADISTNLLKYDNNNVGNVSAKLQYRDELLTPDIVFQNYDNKGSLKISGNMPFKNPLVKQDSAVEFVNNPVAIKLNANDFQIEYFSKLVPSLGEISGTLKGELSANGTASNPNLAGKLSMSNGSYYLPITGMFYDFKFDVSTSNSMLMVDRFSLLNPDDDSKHLDLVGNIDFKGMKINNIDLQALGDVYVLDQTVEENPLGITGEIYIGSGTPPITIKGNLEKLNVAGQLLIKDATIESVPLKGSGYDIGPDNFVYINASDTSYQKGDSLIAIGPKRYSRLNPFEKYKYRLSKTPASVWDFLNLDINVKTEKDLNIDMSLITLARSRLYGMIQADVNLKTENKILNAYGTAEVVGNSYFRLYKDFKLKDSRVTFNGPLTNPMLDLRAVYSGTKNVEQYGTITSIPVQVAAYVQGNVDTPKVTFKLIQDGDEVTGDNAGGDAVTFLLFGKFRSDLTSSQQSALASGIGQSVGSYYASSYLTDALREVLPFIVGAEFKYSEGDVIKNTDVAVTSELGDATIKVGSHEVKNVNYFEFTIDYPISKLLNLNLPETLLLEIAKEMLTYSTITTIDQQSRFGLKLIYKFRF